MRKILVTLTVLMLMTVCLVYGGDSYKIRVNKTTNCVTVYKNNEPFKAMVCSTGKNGSTPSGIFKTQAKYTWRPLFGDVYGQYATRIHGNILFHSVYYKTTSPDTLKAEEYNKLGIQASMGCIRLSVADAKWIYDNCPLGTVVEVVESGTDPLPKPKAMYLGENAPYKNWDPTDDNPNNPWLKVKGRIELPNYNKVIYSDEVNTPEYINSLLKRDVKAYDMANNLIEFTISHNINTDVKGDYVVTYAASDCLGNKIEESIMVKVE